jgi:hypothetical protein
MNAFFELYGGAMAVLLSIFSTIYMAIKWRSYRQPTARKFVVALLYWGPLFLICCMLLHNVQNIYRAIVSYQATSTFNFYYYSLQLFGCVIAYQAYILLMSCRNHVNTTNRFSFKVMKQVCLIVLTTLPTFAFTPIGIIPSVIMLITFLCAVFVHKSEINIETPVLKKIKTEIRYEAQEQTLGNRA